MKFLQVTTVDSTIKTFLIPHLKMFRENGFEIEIACKITDFKKELDNTGYPVFPMSFSRSVFDLRNFFSLFQMFFLIRKQKYDILATTTPVGSFVSRISARLAGVPLIIYTVHGFHFHKYGNPVMNAAYLLLEKFLALFTDAIITTNQEDYEMAQKFYKKDKVFFMYGVGINAEFWKKENVSKEEKERKKQELGLNNEEKVIGMIAEFNPGKRHIDFIKAAELLLKESKNIKFVLVGEGRLKESYQRLVKEMNIDDHFIFTGFQEDVRTILSLFDVLILPSIREGLPRSISEGMSMEIPVIGADVRGLKDVIQDKVNGFLVEPKSAIAIKNALTEILGNDIIAERMGKEGRRIILEHFDEKKLLKEELLIYKKLVNDIFTTK